MRRPRSTTIQSERGADLRKNLTSEQLEWIGTIIIAWNELEILIDFAMNIGLGVSAALWFEVSTRINGIDGKVELIRQAKSEFLEIDQSISSAIGRTLNGVTECKKYRDGVGACQSA
jgi:hypothetical protein